MGFDRARSKQVAGDYMNLTTGSLISFFTLRRAMMYEDYCDTLQFISCNFLALPGINFRNIFLQTVSSDCSNSIKLGIHQSGIHQMKKLQSFRMDLKV